MLEVLAVHRRAVKFEKGYTVFKRAGEKHLPFSDALAMLENTSTSGRLEVLAVHRLEVLEDTNTHQPKIGHIFF